MNLKRLVFTLAATACLSTTYSANAGTEPDLPGFQTVSNVLSYGGAPTAHGIKLLADRHFDTIVDLRPSNPKSTDEQRETTHEKMNYISLPVGNDLPTQQQVTRFLQIVELAQPKKNMDWLPAVYVHGEGPDAAPALVAIWRVTHDKWDLRRAMKEAKHGGLADSRTDLAQLIREYFDGTKQ